MVGYVMTLDGSDCELIDLVNEFILCVMIKQRNPSISSIFVHETISKETAPQRKKFLFRLVLFYRVGWEQRILLEDTNYLREW
jgi:hypothetical protein